MSSAAAPDMPERFEAAYRFARNTLKAKNTIAMIYAHLYTLLPDDRHAYPLSGTRGDFARECGVSRPTFDSAAKFLEACGAVRTSRESARAALRLYIERRPGAAAAERAGPIVKIGPPEQLSLFGEGQKR